MLGLSFVFLFFFMEETNYDRSTVGVVNHGTKASGEPKDGLVSSEKSPATAAGSPETGSLEAGNTTYKEKTFVQRLALWDAPRKQRMPYRFWLSLKLTTWPVIFYSGFSYGSYLIWFNVSDGLSARSLGNMHTNHHDRSSTPLRPLS